MLEILMLLLNGYCHVPFIIIFYDIHNDIITLLYFNRFAVIYDKFVEIRKFY